MIGPFHPDVLLDTNVFSYVFKGHTFAKQFIPHIAGKRRYLSFMTVAELYRGAYKVNWDKGQIDTLTEALRDYVILTANTQTARRWAWLKEYCRSKLNRTISDADAWIGASALTYNLPLVTNDVKDFKDIPGITLLY